MNTDGAVIWVKCDDGCKRVYQKDGKTVMIKAANSFELKKSRLDEVAEKLGLNEFDVEYTEFFDIKSGKKLFEDDFKTGNYDEGYGCKSKNTKIYYKKDKSYTVWVDGYPVFEWIKGFGACNDKATLADCYL